MVLLSYVTGTQGTLLMRAMAAITYWCYAGVRAMPGEEPTTSCDILCLILLVRSMIMLTRTAS